LVAHIDVHFLNVAGNLKTDTGASTTPENCRILPEACSETVMVLMARMGFGGGGGSSRQAVMVKRIDIPKKACTKGLQN
jgi:hypothetical protein